MGMQQIPNGETCANDNTYSVIAYLRTGPATVATFCKGGTVTSIMARYKGRLHLRVPGNTAIDPVAFKFKVGPAITASKSHHVLSFIQSLLLLSHEYDLSVMIYFCTY